MESIRYDAETQWVWRQTQILQRDRPEEAAFRQQGVVIVDLPWPPRPAHDDAWIPGAVIVTLARQPRGHLWRRLIASGQ